MRAVSLIPRGLYTCCCWLGWHFWHTHQTRENVSQTPLHTVSRKHVIQPENHTSKTLGTGVSLNVPLVFSGSHSYPIRKNAWSDQGHIQAHTGAQRFATVSGLNDMFPGNCVQRCAMGFEIRFLLFGGCVRNVSPISSNMNINHAVLKRQLAQWIQVKSFTTVSAAARNNWRY